MLCLTACRFDSDRRHMERTYNNNSAYIVGVSLGDGNLSNPNKRAVRLRITCDNKYPIIINSITNSLAAEFPNNKVSLVKRNDNCTDVSVYSDKLEIMLGWNSKSGPKIKQNVGIPIEILNNPELIIPCLKGLFETDGSIYYDRNYLMLNFVTKIPRLADNVIQALNTLNIEFRSYKIKEGSSYRWNIRISKDARKIINLLNIQKTQKPKVIIVLGRTATGKSDLAVLIARKYNGEIISADSRQVYKGLNIGSGKITKKEMRGVKHYMLDVASPKSVFTVAKFKQKANKAIDEIISKGKIPIIAGGTAFYIDAVVYNQMIPEVKPDKQLRDNLGKKSLEELGKILRKLDKDRFEEIDLKNKVRLIRAIEIVNVLGKVPKMEPKASLSAPFETLFIGLDHSDEILRERIHNRLLKRSKGMINEAKKLKQNGLSFKRMKELGLEYRYLAKYLQKEIAKEDMLSELETKIWQFSRRQRTWFRKNKEIKWFKPTDINKIEREIEKFLK